MTEEYRQSNENIAQTVARLMQDREIAPEVSDSVVAIPDHWSLQDLERYLDRPRRNDLKLSMHTFGGFADYVVAHAVPDVSAVYVDADAVTAVIDDIPRGPGINTAWRKHQVVLPLARTAEWQAWQTLSGRFTPQREFADLIQDRATEISAPPLADLVQELRNISANSTGQRRDSTNHLSQKSERSAATAISNNLPEFLDLRLPILKCEPDVQTSVQARLYTKLTDDGVEFCVQLVNELVIVDERIRQFVDRLKTHIGATVPVYF